MCIFCKIVNGEIPSYKIYEDNDFLAFMDISPATIGHTLVIPKKHYDSIFSLDEDTKIFSLVIKLSKVIKEALDLEGMNILNNNGEVAGQSVKHFHIHLIPRYKDDNLKMNLPESTFNKDEFEKIQKRILEKI